VNEIGDEATTQGAQPEAAREACTEASQDGNREARQNGSRDDGIQAPRLALRSAGPEQTRHLGAALGRLLAASDVVLLTGELGAGKTAFTQGIGAGLGIAGVINSPTFTIVKEYDGRVRLYHFDLYRIEDPEELYALGFEEYFGGAGVAVVEWAERGEDDTGGAVWPASWIRIELRATAPEQRLIELSAVGERGHALLEAFARVALPLARPTPALEGNQRARQGASSAGESA
jgi:tRNA threonylcarbamoyladenosine biosynthesis protein TsaE